MASTNTINLSLLAAPTFVESLDFETILATRVAKMVELYPDFDSTRLGDPAMKALMVGAYEELLIRQQFNERAKALLLAYAENGDLDQLGARLNVARLDGELDDAYRARIQLAPTSFSVAGPAAAYRYFALSAASTIADASVTAPKPDDIKALVDSTLAAQGVSAGVRTALRAALDAATWPGTVLVSVLSTQGDGTASDAELTAVRAAVADDAAVRPLTDYVVVQSAEIVHFDIVAEITVKDGPDNSVVLTASQEALATYETGARVMGGSVNRAPIIAAINGAEVDNTNLISPAADTPLTDTQAPYFASNSITVASNG